MLGVILFPLLEQKVERAITTLKRMPKYVISAVLKWWCGAIVCKGKVGDPVPCFGECGCMRASQRHFMRCPNLTLKAALEFRCDIDTDPLLLLDSHDGLLVRMLKCVHSIVNSCNHTDFRVPFSMLLKEGVRYVAGDSAFVRNVLRTPLSGIVRPPLQWPLLPDHSDLLDP